MMKRRSPALATCSSVTSQRAAALLPSIRTRPLWVTGAVTDPRERLVRPFGRGALHTVGTDDAGAIVEIQADNVRLSAGERQDSLGATPDHDGGRGRCTGSGAPRYP